MTVDAAKKNKIVCAMCGEMAGVPYFTPFLIGIGIDELSMIASSIPEVKKVIRSFTMKEAAKISRNVLHMEDAEQIKKYLRSMIVAKFPEMKNL